MKKKILIVGANGKMGSEICEKLKNDYEIIKVTKEQKWTEFGADLVIDFGSAESSVLSAKYCFEKHIPLIVGSTGQSESQLEKIWQVASVAPLMVCSNFSVGIARVKKCLAEILKEEISDICIFEKHHKEKKDSPSGTAILLEKFISSKTKVPVQILSQRGGEEIGTHKIDFYLNGEAVSITHQAFSRAVFAEGVKKAVVFMLQQKMPKEYFFDDII
ncbi:MAG: hypothetical protein IKD36_00320 [Clostridia bacterium]|nr:hypothetical protein [Clostridia bacterium]